MVFDYSWSIRKYILVFIHTHHMKYTKTKLEELKHIRHSARAEHRAFLEARPYPNNFSQRAGILKEKRDSTRKIYHKYRKRYSNYKLSKRRIKKYKKEMKRSEEKRMNESLIMCQCLDNIAVETNHSSVEELLRNAITSYTREQPVRFEGVLPFIMAYDNSSKLYKGHEAAGEQVRQRGPRSTYREPDDAARHADNLRRPVARVRHDIGQTCHPDAAHDDGEGIELGVQLHIGDSQADRRLERG